jgi:hypothetical protein
MIQQEREDRETPSAKDWERIMESLLTLSRELTERVTDEKQNRQREEEAA